MDNLLKSKILKKALEAYSAGHQSYAFELLRYLSRECPDDIEVKAALYKAYLEQPIINRTNKIKAFIAKTKAEMLMQKGDMDNAIELFEDALRLNPNDYSILISLVNILISKNKKAVGLLDLIHSDTIQDLNTLKKIAQIYLSAKDHANGKKILKRILTLYPQDIESQRMLKNIEALGVLQKDFQSPK